MQKSSFEINNTPVALTTGVLEQHKEILTLKSITERNVPVIAGIAINTDEEGRFNLNALHKASGLGTNKRPSKWLATDQAKGLITEIEANLLKKSQSPISGSAQKAINVINGGTAPGTFAHELLAVSYAGWISPAFQLKVNQTFLDYRSGKLVATPVDPIVALNDPATMRGLLLTYTEKVLTLENQVQEMKPEVDALHRIAKSEGAVCITNAAKDLQMRPKDLFSYLSAQRWIYRRPGGKHWLAYQNQIQRGVLMHKVHVVTQSDGTEKIGEQVLVTPKGLTELSQRQRD